MVSIIRPTLYSEMHLLLMRVAPLKVYEAMLICQVQDGTTPNDACTNINISISSIKFAWCSPFYVSLRSWNFYWLSNFNKCHKIWRYEGFGKSETRMHRMRCGYYICISSMALILDFIDWKFSPLLTVLF